MATENVNPSSVADGERKYLHEPQLDADRVNVAMECSVEIELLACELISRSQASDNVDHVVHLIAGRLRTLSRAIMSLLDDESDGVNAIIDRLSVVRS